jgi:hypothetical protein
MNEERTEGGIILAKASDISPKVVPADAMQVNAPARGDDRR